MRYGVGEACEDGGLEDGGYEWAGGWELRYVVTVSVGGGHWRGAVSRMGTRRIGRPSYGQIIALRDVELGKDP